MITELCRLKYTYSEYFYAHWVNCTKMCKKIQKTIIFSTYLPKLGALWSRSWQDFAQFCLNGWGVGSMGRNGHRRLSTNWKHFFSVLGFLPIQSKKRIILHFFSIVRAHCSRIFSKRPIMLNSMQVASGASEHGSSKRYRSKPYFWILGGQFLLILLLSNCNFSSDYEY